MLKYRREGGLQRFKNVTHKNRWVNTQPEVKRVVSEKAKKRMRPGSAHNLAMRRFQAERYENPEEREKAAERTRKMWLDPEYREAHSGTEHWAWRHGEARNFRGSGWSKIRVEIRERDGNKCKGCNAPYQKGYLICHHIKPFTGDEERENDSSNLITLCRACHVLVERGHMECPSL